MKRKSKSFQCQYCKTTMPHMVVLLKEDGDIHVHAPFENSMLMNLFSKAVEKESTKYKNIKR